MGGGGHRGRGGGGEVGGLGGPALGGILELLPPDALVKILEVLAGKVLALVNLAVVPHKVLFGHLVLDARVVEVGVEHDEREGEDIGRIRVREDRGIRLVEPLGELLHDPVDLLGLHWQHKAAKKSSIYPRKVKREREGE